jgi:hypothetical protein
MKDLRLGGRPWPSGKGEEAIYQTGLVGAKKKTGHPLPVIFIEHGVNGRPGK